MTVLCQLHMTGWRLYVSYIQAGWWLSVSYMRQDGGYMSAIWGRMAVICQLNEEGSRLSLSYMRQDSGYLSVTGGRMAVFCIGMCILSATWGRLVVMRMGIWTLLVIWCRLEGMVNWKIEVKYRTWDDLDAEFTGCEEEIAHDANTMRAGRRSNDPL
jgi:hypothetical protein